jgi:hypothetical protein
MIRLHSIVEGQTEEAFFNRALRAHLANFRVYADVQLLSPKRAASRLFKGGWNSYAAAKRHLERWMKQDAGSEVWFTTMFDLYAIPDDFPDLANCKGIQDPFQRVDALESAFSADLRNIGLRHFVPYIQLHEFEALIFANPQKLDSEFLEHRGSIATLVALAAKFASPELINERPTYAPSKRIIQQIPEYEFRKASAGPLVVDKIGLPKLRSSCPHFANWLNKLEALDSLHPDCPAE